MEALQNKINEGEKKHRTHLFLFRWGEKIKRSGQLIWPLLDAEEKPFRTIWSCAVRVLLLICLISVFSDLGMWWMGAVIYGLLHLVLFLIGNAMVKYNQKILDVLSAEIRETWSDFFHQKAAEKSVTIQYPYDACLYEDGVEVNSAGMIDMPLARDFGQIRIFRTGDYRDYEACEKLKEQYAGRTDFLWLKDQVASVEFKKKFRVGTPMVNEINCMVYLSPSTVVRYIDNPLIEKVYNISIEHGRLTAKYDHVVERPANVNVYSFRPFGWYFKDIEKYCDELKRECDQAHACVAPLRGPRA